MGDSVAKRAVRETREMTRLAVDAAKNELIEELAPTIKAIIEKRIREGALADDIDRLRRHADGHGETEFEEGTDMKKKDKKDESLRALFPNISETVEEMDEGRPGKVDAEMDESEIPTLGEGEEVDEAALAEEDGVDEEIEISESELEEMYKEALQLEVDVKKGFSDMGEPKDMGGVHPHKAPALSDPALIAQVKAGEHEWNNEEPPAKKKWTVEQVQQLVAAGLAENKALETENKKLGEMVRKLHGKLTEMNLFNTKVVHANRFMARHKLTTEQKRSVLESIDRAASIQEVKRIYSVLESSFKAAGALTETRRAKADVQKRRTSGAPNERVLRESVDREQGNGGFNRWQTLAGLVEGKKAD